MSSYHVWKAFKYMLISTLAFTLLNVTVKYLSNTPVFQIVFFRASGTLVFTLSLLKIKKINIWGENKHLLWLRSIVGLTSMLLFFYSLKYLSVGSAVSIRYTSPIFAAILALFLLKEKINRWQWMCFAVAFFGVVLLKSTYFQFSTFGLVLLVLSAFFSGLVYIIIRRIGNREHPLVVVNYFMGISAIIGAIFSIGNWQPPSSVELVLLLSLGVYGFLGQLYMTKAFQVEQTNIVAPFKYIEVIFSILFGVVWFGDTYSLLSVMAIALILIGLIFNVKFRT